MPEPTPLRDNGPYVNASQARAQYDAATHGIPCSNAVGITLVLGEALTMTGLAPTMTDHEVEVMEQLGFRTDPATAQVIAGWIIRAHLARTE